MDNKELKDILKIIKETDIVMVKDIVHSTGKDHRYIQGLLEALEVVGLIKFEPKATMKRIKLTDKGDEFLKK
jgi:predicted transcriptional regulator